MKMDKSTPLYTLNGVLFEYNKQADKRPAASAHSLANGGQASSDQWRLECDHLEISKGKLTSILGRSGSGKTTLLSLLGMLRRPTEGRIVVHLHNRQYDALEHLWTQDIEQFRAENIGFALQRGELLPYLTLYENTALLLQFLKKDIHKSEEHVHGILRQLYQGELQEDLFEKVIYSKPSAVSGGQYQRAAIARALANQPAIVLADEPTGNLDAQSGREALQMLRTILFSDRANGADPKSVIVVTHDLHLALEFADEIIDLSNGKVKAQYLSESPASDPSPEKLWFEKNGTADSIHTMTTVQDIHHMLLDTL